VVDLRPGTLSSFDVHTIAMQTAATQAYYQQLRGGDKGLDSWVASVYANQWFTDHLFTGENNVGIAHGVWIENVTTGSAADTVRDNAVDNYIRTGAGDDIISLFGGGFDTVEGGTGTDTVFVTDAVGDIQTEKQTDGSYLVVGSYFAAQLIGVETLSYADGTLALT
jgi:serralysin